MQNLWRDAQDAAADVRLFGDLVLAAFFEGAKPKERESRLAAYQSAILSQDAQRHAVEMEERRNAEVPFAPFHWHIEFPEIFERENPGFDAIVGNPPFAGHVTVVEGNIRQYTDWLRTAHPASTGKCDIVAHFYRGSFDLLRDGGAFGLIATNTIAQGDTRSSGLRWICDHGGEIYRATKRVRWPGDAAVIVSVLHVAKGEFAGARVLDGAPVERITAFLFHRGSHADPVRLAANTGNSFVGSYVLGIGFTFDDTDKKGIASSIAEMQRLIEKDPRNREAIFPYVGGEEVNTSPIHAHHRYVINFGERSERECRRRWPDLLTVLEEKVRPSRLSSAERSKSGHGRRAAAVWWQFMRHAKDLYAATASLDRVLCNSQVSSTVQFAFLPAQVVYAHTLNVYPLDTNAAFCTLQSRVHQIWAGFFGSSMKDDLRYTPSDCFETFPFPAEWETHPALEAAGAAYHEYRAALMVENDEGMTKTYNRFHDIYETDSQIVELRRLHAAMDRAVLDAYGWTDIPTDCEFLLDYEIDEATWGRKKKPYRYRWPDTVREEVLVRFLALNSDRAAGEARESVTPRPTARPEVASRDTAERGPAAKIAASRSPYGSADG